jgi:hypothetical protein
MRGSRSRAATNCISLVPGLAKQAVTPLSARVVIRASAPFMVFSVPLRPCFRHFAGRANGGCVGRANKPSAVWQRVEASPKSAPVGENHMPQSNSLARWVLIASILAGVSYVAAWSLHLPQAAELTWKGLGVGLLAVYAALNARSLDGWLLVAVMAFGALGDVLLGAAGLTVGALAFLVGHLVAIGLYLRNRRQTRPAANSPWPSSGARDRDHRLPAARRPRRRAGRGAVQPGPGADGRDGLAQPLPALSGRDRGGDVRGLRPADLRSGGPLPDSFAVGLAVWGLYYFGQLLICVGVVIRRARDPGSGRTP